MSGKEFAKIIEGYVNTFGTDKKGLKEEFQTMHKTLQQSAIREVVIPIIEQIAANEKFADLRNEAAVAWCKEVLEKCPPNGFPLI